MNKGGKKLILIPVVILLAALIIFRLMHKEAVVEEETRPMVGTELPVVKDIVVKTEAIGTLEPEQEVSVMPKRMPITVPSRMAISAMEKVLTSPVITFARRV